MTGGAPDGSPFQTGPPAAAPRRANGCLIWALAGCGALIVIVIVAVVFFAKGVGNGLVAGEVAAPGCKEKLLSLQSALITYQRDHSGHYPATLTELVPNYLVDDSSFSYQDSTGMHRVDYTPPTANAQDDAVVAGFETGSYQLASIQKSRIYVRLLKNGRVVMDQLARQDVP